MFGGWFASGITGAGSAVEVSKTLRSLGAGADPGFVPAPLAAGEGETIPVGLSGGTDVTGRSPPEVIVAAGRALE
jgi:hypothetical protein